MFRRSCGKAGGAKQVNKKKYLTGSEILGGEGSMLGVFLA